MGNDFKKAGNGRLTYLPQYNHDNSKSEATIIEVKTRKPQKKDTGFSTSAKIKYFILIVGMIILVGIAGRSETDPNFPNKLLVIWSVYDIVGCALAIILVNILKEVFKK